MPSFYVDSNYLLIVGKPSEVHQMAVTLRNRHKLMLRQKLIGLDREFLAERLMLERVTVLIEAMDEDDLKKVSAIINKLRSVGQRAQASSALKQVIDKALIDLQRVTGGDQSLGQRALSAIGRGDNKKIFKNTMALVSALETGFRLMPQLLKNMLGPLQSKSDAAKKTVATLLMGEGILREAPNDNTPDITAEPIKGEEQVDTEKGAKNLELVRKNIVKAMKPSKWWGLSSGEIPYVDDPDGLVTDILNSVPVGELMQIVRTMTSGPQAANLAKDVANGGSGETTGTEGGTETAPSVGSSEGGTQNSVSSDEPRSTAGVHDGPSDDWVADFSNYLAQSTGIDHDSVTKIMNVLAKNGKLREARTLGSSSAAELLRVLANSGKLTEAVDQGIIKIQISETDIQDLVQK